MLPSPPKCLFLTCCAHLAAFAHLCLLTLVRSMHSSEIWEALQCGIKSSLCTTMWIHSFVNGFDSLAMKDVFQLIFN